MPWRHLGATARTKARNTRNTVAKPRARADLLAKARINQPDPKENFARLIKLIDQKFMNERFPTKSTCFPEEKKCSQSKGPNQIVKRRTRRWQDVSLRQPGSGASDAFGLRPRRMIQRGRKGISGSTAVVMVKRTPPPSGSSKKK